MNVRTLIILALAICCGLGTVFVVKRMRGAGAEGTVAEVETVNVVVAAVDLPKLKHLTEKDVTLQPWPKALVPPGAILKVGDAIGKTLRSDMKASQPIFQASIDAGRGIDVLLPDGENMRLVTILTPSEASNVAGLVQPGDHVDINLILSNGGDIASDSMIDVVTGGAHARVLIQNVVIVSVGQQVEMTEGNGIPGPYQSVTLAVTPEQSLILQLAGTKGTLTLALRGTGDTEIVDVNPFTLSELRRLDSFSEQGDQALIAQEADKLESAEVATNAETKTLASALSGIWDQYSDYAAQVAAVKAKEPRQEMVDVYQRIRTYRGTTSGEVLLRTQRMRLVPAGTGDARNEKGEPIQLGANTP